MYPNLNLYVAEETRQAEDLRQAEAYRLVRQAEGTRVGLRKVLSALLVHVGERMVIRGLRMQQQIEARRQALIQVE